jgi:predicted PurR-regulated permease PerM
VPDLEDRTFLWLLLAVSVLFALIVWPFYGAVLWAAIASILFAPVYRRLAASMGQRRNLAALATLAIIVVMVIVPLTLITAALVQEAAGVYERIQSGELDFRRYFQQVFDALPAWAAALLDRFGLTNLAAAQEQLSAGLMRASQFLAAQAISIGQRTFDFVVSLFVMLYVLFFLLRDGDRLTSRV